MAPQGNPEDRRAYRPETYRVFHRHRQKPRVIWQVRNGSDYPGAVPPSTGTRACASESNLLLRRTTLGMLNFVALG